MRSAIWILFLLWVSGCTSGEEIEEVIELVDNYGRKSQPNGKDRVLQQFMKREITKIQGVERGTLTSELFLKSHKSGYPQGMAIYGETVFLLSEYGDVQVYDIPSDTLIYKGRLASRSGTNHANTAVFSGQFYHQEDKYPLLYVSQNTPPARCYVERFHNNGFELVQTISIDIPELAKEYRDFLIDSEHSYLITTSRLVSPDEKMTFVLRYFQLPNPNIANVTLTLADLIKEQRIQFDFKLNRQGATIYNGKLYCLFGGYSEGQRLMCLIDLNNYSYQKYNLTNVVGYELEDVSIYKNEKLITHDASGELRHIFLKEKK